MPRKTKSAQAQPTLTNNEAQPTAADARPAPEQVPPSGRDSQGKFAAGNRGGPGNPHARHCARMLEIFRNAISEEDFVRVVRRLLEKAEAGDTSAAKILVSYVIGKPLAAPHPDSIDRDEWDHYQKDAVQAPEMKLVLSSLPTHVGNDVARVALPIMTEARTHDLAKQLLKGCPGGKGVKTGARDEENSESSDPLSNGDLSEQPIDPGTLHPSPATPQFDPWDIDAAMAASTAQQEANTEHEMECEKQENETAPIANGKLNGEMVRSSTQYTPPARPSELIPNGRKMYGKKMRKNVRANHSVKSSRPRNAEPLRNGKLNEKSISLSTRHTPPATTSQPSARNAHGKKIEGKKIRKKAETSRLQPLAQ